MTDHTTQPSAAQARILAAHNPIVNPIIHPSAPDPLNVFDLEADFEQDSSTNDLIINHHQYIPDNFISDLKSEKMASASVRSGDMMLALSVPVSVIEDLKRKYNFDAMNAPIAEIRKMLQRLHLDAFIATNKT